MLRFFKKIWNRSAMQNKDISYRELKTLMKTQNIVLIDVRSGQEYGLKVNSWGKTSSKCFAPAFLIGLNKTHKNKLK